MDLPTDASHRDDRVGARDAAGIAGTRLATERDSAAVQRDKRSRSREQAVRDQVWADEVRDAVADRRDAGSPTSAEGRAEVEQQLVDREVAAANLQLGRRDRRALLQEARDDRRGAAPDRQAAAADLLSAASDRAAGAADRRAAASDRHQAEIQHSLAQLAPDTEGDSADRP